MIAGTQVQDLAQPAQYPRRRLTEPRVVRFSGTELACLLLLLIHGIELLGCRRSDGFRFQVASPDTQGLKKHATVFYRGVEVGKVERVSLQPSSSKDATEVVVDVILTGLHAQVRRDDIVRATLFGLLGERVIDIIPGASSSLLITNGSKLKGGSAATA